MQGAAMWGGALMLALAMWMLARRGDGRSGDLRAVALCEDAPALVRALSVVHAVRRIPRRLSAFDEETSAHPSLARRLQAIREAAGLAPAALVSPVVLSAPDLARVVVLDAERVQWLEGVSAGVAREADAVRVSADSVRSLAYRQLTDLRLVTGRRGATWLRATHRSGRSWSAPIRTQDLAAAQTALDVIDERLSAEHSVTRRRGALLIAFAAAAAVSAWAQVGPSPIIVLAALVAARPRQSPSWVVALLIGVWAVQHGIAARAAMPSLVAPLTAALMAVGAMAFVVGPAVRRRAVLRPTPGQTAAVTGALAGFAVVLGADVLWVARLAAAPIPSWRVDAVALALLAATIVVALGQWRRRWVSAAAGAALGLAVFQWGPAAVAAWAPLASGTPLAAHEVSTPSSRVVPLDASARRLVVSPSASQFAVQIGRSRTNMPYDTVLARFDGPPRHLSAYDLAFVDDTVALLIGRGITGLELKALPLDSAAVPDPLAWSIALPAVYEPRLSVDAPSGVWTIVGWHPDEADAISVTGRIGDDARQVKRWAIPGEDAHASFSYLPALDTAFSVTRTSLTHWPALLSRLAGVPEHRWELWKLDGKTGATVAVTAADLTCLDPLARDEVLLCLARHPTHTVIWSVDGRTGRITEVGATGPVRLARLRPGHVRLVMMDGEILRIPRGGRQALRFTPAPEPGHVIEMDSTTDHVALLMRTRAETRLALHPAR
jgi:hypothetical protein